MNDDDPMTTDQIEMKELDQLLQNPNVGRELYEWLEERFGLYPIRTSRYLVEAGALEVVHRLLTSYIAKQRTKLPTPIPLRHIQQKQQQQQTESESKSPVATTATGQQLITTPTTAITSEGAKPEVYNLSQVVEMNDNEMSSSTIAFSILTSICLDRKIPFSSSCYLSSSQSSSSVSVACL
jgi:hypothetical protein